MLPTQTIYPHFEANQVLTKSHLNDLFNFLDEQNRLTRTNLIGIGIVCGLDVETAADGRSLTISRGCGITSEGYLVSMEEFTATHSEIYEVPKEIKYPVLYNDGAQSNRFDLWELTNTGANGGIPLSPGFLADKIVMVFVELLENPLRNCSPNSCDDKGATIQMAFKPLLIRRNDANTILADVAALPGAGNSTDISNLIDASANLQEMRIPRVSVPFSPIISTTHLIDSYRSILSRPFIEGVIRTNLLAAFDTFQLLIDGLDRNAISNWVAPYAPDDLVRFNNPHNYQYYYDFISDLIETYREIRLKGIDTLSLCCPNPNLFPRHLFLKEAGVGVAHERQYRHYFIPSPINDHHRGLSQQIRNLFERLIAQIQRAQFPLPITAPPFIRGYYDSTIKITPSKLGAYPLSDKAIPYYYDVTSGAPTLYELWNRRLTQNKKAKHNLSYHANQYPAPVPDFVLRPNHYDLEPYNFLRIEGHVGKNIQTVLSTLAYLQANERLPFDFVGIKTGSSPVTSIREQDFECHFQDLETIYVTNKEELCCLICKVVRHFYQLELFGDRGQNPQPTAIPELQSCGDNITYTSGSFGAIFEQLYPQLNEQNFSFFTNSGINAANFGGFFFIFYLIKIKSAMEVNLSRFISNSQETFNNFYTVTEQLGFALRTLAANNAQQGNNFVQTEDLIDHIDAILLACKKEVFDKLVAEYNRRVLNIQEQFLLGNYTRQHPGINHKAGVPIGGTFLVVYHGDDDPQRPPVRPRPAQAFAGGFVTNAQGEPLAGALVVDRQSGASIPTNARGQFLLFLPYLPSRLDISLNGYRSATAWVTELQQSLDIILEVGDDGGDLEDGTVIADFYLPYLCCSDCPPVQFVLSQPTIAPLDVSLGDPICSQDNTNFTVRVTVSGGTPPYQRADGTPIVGNSFEVVTASGDSSVVVINDSTGEQFTVEIEEHTCEVAPPLVATASNPICNPAGTEFTVTVNISGGIPPYRQDNNSVNGNQFDRIFGSGTGGTITVTDSSGLSFPVTITSHNCPAPPALSASAGLPECTPNNDRFNVNCTISGGVPPYTQNNNPVNGSSFSVEFTSGSGGNIEIRDSIGQTTPLNIPVHNCEAPCELPCDGVFTICHYLPWFNRPKDGAVYKVEFVEIVDLKITDENGNERFNESLTAQVEDVIVTQGSVITPQNYDQLMSSIIKRINAEIINKLGNNPPFEIEYDLDNDVLVIGHYRCYTFEFAVLIGVANANGVSIANTYIYDQRSLEIQFPSDPNARNFIDKFGCITEFRCSGDPTQLGCQSEAQFELKLDTVAGSNKVNIELSNPSGAGIQRIYWLIEAGDPPFLTNTDSIEVTIVDDYSPVCVLIIDDKNCWAYICQDVRIPAQGNDPGGNNPSALPLTVNVGRPICAPDNESFRVNFMISGGVPPYRHDRGDINGNSFSRVFPNGGSGTIDITDAAGNRKEAIVNLHRCLDEGQAGDCDLPCNGEFMTCRFVPWFHKPTKNDDKYKYDSGEQVILSLRDETGKEILKEDLSAIIKKEMNKVRRSITPANYDRVMNNIVNVINKFLIEKLGTPPAFQLGYDAEEGVLQISHYACYTFDLNIPFTTTIADQNPIQDVYNYSQDGLLIGNKEEERQIEVKKFGCEVVNLCTEKRILETCQSKQEYQLRSARGRTGINLSIKGEKPPKEVCWIVPGSKPKSGEGEEFKTTPPSNLGHYGVVIIDDQGCWKYLTGTYSNR